MKTLIRIIILATCFILSACAAGMKNIQISGTPGTIIKNSSGEVLGTIGSDGNAKVKIYRDKYHAFLLSKSPNSDIYVPFALEYKNVHRTSSATCVIVGTCFYAIPPIWIPLCWASYQDDITNGYRYIPSHTNEDLNIIQ